MNSSSSSIDTEFPGLTAALAGAYRLERELGRGGMGVVFLAHDDRLDRQVALKVLPPAVATVPAVRERFLREARTSAQLAHPNIVPIYSADEAGVWAYFVMAYIDGETLGQRVAALGRLEPAEVVRMIRDAAWALAYAHARGLVHRDVKPDNLMVERTTGRVVVTDFGIAHAPESSPLTQTGLVMGSVHFMSPEQGAGEPLDGRSDLYALGTVAFLLLSGRLPFEHEQASAILVQRATRDAPLLRSVAPDAPPSVAAVIDSCLARDPTLRPPSGEALAEMLERGWQQDAAAHEAGSPSESALSEEEAHRVWRRAAQLQAQAAARLESRTREQWALGGAKGDGADASSSPTHVSRPEGEPAAGALSESSAFPVNRVQAAAEEAGISRQYVAVALAELRAGREAGTALATPGGGSDVVARVVLGPSPRALTVSRVFNHSPREVLAAMGVALQRAPCGLRLRETFGGHALYGGTLVFEVPAAVTHMTTSGFPATAGGYLWNAVRHQLWVSTLRAQLSAAPGTSGRCEVTFTIEPPEGRTSAMGVSAALGAGGGMFGALTGAILVKKAVLLSLLGMPTVVPLLATGVGLGALVHRIFYQRAMRGARREMNSALDEVAHELTVEHTLGDPFGDPLVRKLPRR